MTSTIEVNALILFGSVIRDYGTTEYAIAKQQLALKDENRHSWFANVR